MKKIISLFMITLWVILVNGCQQTASLDDEGHYDKIKKIIEEKYLTQTYGFTSFELYNVYNENDEPEYYLAEFEPFGYLYIKVNERSYPGNGSIYSTSHEFYWTPYKVVSYGSGDTAKHRYVYQYNELGEKIIYNRSHFKVANVTNERMYLLRVGGDSLEGLIPAIKNGNKYINLVSMEEFDYNRNVRYESVPIGLMEIEWYPPYNL